MCINSGAVYSTLAITMRRKNLFFTTQCTSIPTIVIAKRAIKCTIARAKNRTHTHTHDHIPRKKEEGNTTYFTRHKQARSRFPRRSTRCSHFGVFFWGVSDFIGRHALEVLAFLRLLASLCSYVFG